MDDSEQTTLNQRIRNLSEPQQIEYRRRLDTCYAVITFMQSLVEDRRGQSELVQEQSKIAKAKWPWVVAILGWLLVWAGKELDLPTVTIGYLMFGVSVYVVASACYNDWKARDRLESIEQRMLTLRFQWVASGAFMETLNAYCTEIGKEGSSVEIGDSPAIHHQLQNALLGSVGA